VDHILNGTPLPEIAGHVLALMVDAEARPITRIGVSAAKDGRFKVKIV
jgi:type VI secretion system protein VasG